eukprot:jgi/Hompol1/3598/HPOL_006635-RA
MTRKRPTTRSTARSVAAAVETSGSEHNLRKRPAANRKRPASPAASPTASPAKRRDTEIRTVPSRTAKRDNKQDENDSDSDSDYEAHDEEEQRVKPDDDEDEDEEDDEDDDAEATEEAGGPVPTRTNMRNSGEGIEPIERH